MPEQLRDCLKEPVQAIFRAWDLLSSAADAHVRGDHAAAEMLFREADIPEVWNWVNPGWVKPQLFVKVLKPDGDTFEIPSAQRHSSRNPTKAIKATVLARDGHKCRYCGIPVVDADIRKLAQKLYPRAVRWDWQDPSRQHAGFQCFWLQYDHVVPHSHGGESTEDNLVICCALCNYGKDKYTLRQLGLSDPRLRPPAPDGWDGLERLRRCGSRKP